MTLKRYSLWLLFEEESEVKIAQIIKKVKQKFGIREFIPHVTVIPNIGKNCEAKDNLLEQIAHEMSAIEIFPLKVHTPLDSHAWVELEDSPTLKKINKICRSTCKTKTPSSYKHHFSLAYDNSSEVSSFISEKFSSKLILEKYRLDKIAIVETTKGLGCENWRIIKSLPLSKN